MFIEQDVDAPLGGRLDRWFDAYATPGTVYLPLVMVDSGNQIDSGDTLHQIYGDMTISHDAGSDDVGCESSAWSRSATTAASPLGGQPRNLTACLREPANPSRVGGTAAITTLADDATRANLRGPAGPDRTLGRLADYRPRLEALRHAAGGGGP